MSRPLRIAALVGSLRTGSYNRRLFELAQQQSPDDVELFELSIRDIPLYDEDLRDAGVPEAVRALADGVASADAVLFVTPEYNYSIPGVLKNAIDWVSRESPQPFAGKPVAIMGASGGRLGTARMQYHLRQVLVFLDAHPINKPEVMVAGARGVFADDGTVADEKLPGFVRAQLESLADWTRRIA